MQITGFSYLVFFGTVLSLHWLLQGRHTAQKIMLIVASYYFYSTLDWRFLLLLVSLTAINFGAGLMVHRASSLSQKRVWIAVAVVLSAAILGYFKYLNFFGSMVNSLALWFGSNSLVPLVNVILPVGISFITFQAMTYPIDLYYGRLQRPFGLVDFSLFIAFFPRLLAGPIVPASYFLPQLEAPAPRVSVDQRLEGLTLIMLGLFKKVVLADILGSHLVNPAFADPASFSSGFLWLALFGYSFQVYLDLSGYTDMAIGAARMLGYQLPSNFNRPYMATGIGHFWRLWHITMSSFFRNYLYIPLSKSWNAPVVINLLIVFVAIGLWHGAGWNFVIYGLIHGSLVAFERVRKDRRTRLGLEKIDYQGSRLALRIAFIFTVVVLTRSLFRSSDLSSAGTYLSLMVNSPTNYFPLSLAATLALATAALMHFTPVKWRDDIMAYASRQADWLIGLAFVGTVYMVVAFTHGSGGFIYFRF